MLNVGPRSPGGFMSKATSILVGPTEVISLSSLPKLQCVRLSSEAAMSLPKSRCLRDISAAFAMLPYSRCLCRSRMWPLQPRYLRLFAEVARCNVSRDVHISASRVARVAPRLAFLLFRSIVVASLPKCLRQSWSTQRR